MNCLEIFELLSPLHDKPEAFQEQEAKVLEYIMEEVCTTDAQREWYSMYRWECEKVLRKIKDPIARMNKSIELFWIGFDKFNKVWDDNIEDVVKYLEEVRDAGSMCGEDNSQ